MADEAYNACWGRKEKVMTQLGTLTASNTPFLIIAAGNRVAETKVCCHPLRVAAVTPSARERISRYSPRNRRRTASRLRWRDIRPPRPKPAPPEAAVSVVIVTLLRITSAYRVSQRTGERSRSVEREQVTHDFLKGRNRLLVTGPNLA